MNWRTFLRIRLIGLLLVSTQVGCGKQLSELLGGNFGKKIGAADAPSPLAPSSVSDGAYSLSTTMSPVISWNSCSSPSASAAIVKHEVRIIRVSDSAVIKNWSLVPWGTNVSGLNLSLGQSYRAEVRCTDSNGRVSAAAAGDGWTIPASPLLTVSSIALLAGETEQLALTGGAPVYTYADGGSGYVGTSTGLYAPPLGSVAQTDSVTVTDSLAQTSAAASVKVRAFSTPYTLSATGTQSLAISHKNLAELGGNLFGVSTAGGSALIFKSTDNGATWTKISEYKPVTGFTLATPYLFSDGTKLILTGNFMSTAGGNKSVTVSDSSDGITWTLRMNYLAGSASHILRSFVKAGDGRFIFVGDHDEASGDSTTYVRRCESDWSSCANTYTYTGGYSSNAISKITRDAAGSLYMSARLGPSAAATAVYVKKSIDDGVTWSDFYTWATASTSIRDMAVSADGQTLVFGGALGASTPYSYFSNDAGVSWTYVAGSVNLCSAWSLWQVYVRANGDILGTCYGAFPTVDKIIFKAKAASVWTTLSSLAGSSQGNLLVRGSGDVVYAETVLGVIQSTADFGATWTALTPMPTSYAGVPYNLSFSSVLQNNSGHLFAAGYEKTGASNSTASIYKSTDGGSNWVSNYAYAAGSVAFVSMAQSPTTNTLVVFGQNGANWSVHKSNAAGTSWAVAENHTNGSYTSFSAGKVVSDATGVFYAMGSAYVSASFRYIGYVRTSTDDGVSWTTIDSFLYDSTALRSTQFFGGGMDGATLYMAGYGSDSGGVGHWLVRKYASGTWTIDDDDNFSALSAQGAKAREFLKATDGSLYVVGEYTSASGVRHWVVKRKAAGASVWVVVDDFNFNTSYDAIALGITQDSTGRILVSGHAIDVDGNQYGVVRSLRGSTWATVDKFVDYSGTISNQIIPCLSDQLCIAGSRVSNLGILSGLVRILSP